MWHSHIPPRILSLQPSCCVDRHLPADVMMSASDHVPKSVSFSGAAMTVDAASHDDANATSRASKGVEDGTRRRRPHIPMEHARGVLCLCAVPGRTRDQAKSATVTTTQRFLSGGADGQVKLWEVDKCPAEKGADGKAGDGKDGYRGEGDHPVPGEDVSRTLGVRTLGRGPGRAVRVGPEEGPYAPPPESRPTARPIAWTATSPPA